MEHMREPKKSPAPSVIKANARAAPGGGLEWVLDAVVDASCKAWPPQLGPRRVRDIGGLGLNLYRGDLPAPVAVLREEALAANEEWMRLFLASTKTLLCPHGKTTMRRNCSRGRSSTAPGASRWRRAIKLESRGVPACAKSSWPTNPSR